MASRYDVVVVGARCAGSPLAALCSERGLRVLVLDKTEPTTDTPSTHGIQPTGVQVLERLGVADALAARTDPVTHARLAFNRTRVETGDVLPATGAPMLNLRRPVLDPILADRARSAGAEVRTGVAVTGLVRSASGRVAGVLTDDGAVDAALVVGADGVRSTVARLVGARQYLTTSLDRAFVWGYFEGVTPPAHTVWIGVIGDDGFLASPTSDGLFMACVAISKTGWPDARRDLDGAFASATAGWPELAEVLREGRRVGALHVMAHGDGYFRESAGPGWALVGDAGHFKDPTPGQGIADALRQVERLAPAVEAALDGQGTRALTEWWRWRDHDAIEMYWLARQMGAGGPLPAVLETMLAQLTSTPEGIAAFVQVLNHDVAPSKVFRPGALARAVVDEVRSGEHQRGQLLRETWTLARDQARQQCAGTRALRKSHRSVTRR